MVPGGLVAFGVEIRHSGGGLGWGGGWGGKKGLILGVF